MAQESTRRVPTEPESLREAIDTFHVFCGVVLLSFARHGEGLRETIARNFIARGMSCTQSIFAVWKAGSDQDAWILHRSLIDRLLHLHYLGVTDTFAQFDDYSFLSKYAARHRLLSDPYMSSRIPKVLKELQKTNKARFDLLSSEKRASWQRPKAQDVAKEMDLSFLYNLSYDYASMHVHPMSDDGYEDFKALIESPPKHVLPDATVVRNSILVQSLIVQEALNVSKMSWRAILYDFLTQIRAFLGTSDPRYQATMYKIGNIWPKFDLCESPIADDAA
jgi:hypothetical protein